MFEHYEEYLNAIQNRIDKFFERQKPYIACKMGCSLCCENGEYPFSEMEFNYAMFGLNLLEHDLREKILEAARKIKKEKQEYKGDGVFMHKCPFLIDNKCSIYAYRGLICRTFGLIANREKQGKLPAIPFCCSLGLNYSKVYDEAHRSISNEMYQKLNIDTPPLIFNISYDFLTEDAFADGYGFSFGEKKALIDWF